ncbi:hypothetical protein DE146DRAFT_42323 [Phaeosphaeria sp. MPI-PUGE-AT-0046c]|nr:hypothetical protein DE146DRAFT_42323 [Phaeosphaeria sp. MPI-PUGE-AT-0046c]
MGRNRGKFSFPVPGRRSQKKAGNDSDYDRDAGSTPSIPSAHEWPSRREESSSKAHRVLGTSDPMFRTTSKQSVPASPGYMSLTVSEASYGSHHNDQASVRDRSGYLARPGVSRRPSSNVIGHAYSEGERRGSDYSTNSRRLHPQTSNSTMRSHYDAKSSPLAISQQTSDSAVRDMALRRGHPQIVTDYSGSYVASPVSPAIQEEARRKEQRRSKPARLDLSKLFPKPRGGDSPSYSDALLSPTKMVNSPAAMSFTSDYHFPRPMTREPTPNPNSKSQLKPKKLQRKTPSTPSTPYTPNTPVRKIERDVYDNAKVHVRRPPKGVQHWFDALDEDSDDAVEDPVPIHAPTAVRPYDVARGPTHQTSFGRLAPDSRQSSRSHRVSPAGRHDTFSHEDLVDVTRLTSPSQYSLQSTKTKESALSKSNLQDSSVLSFSSSEDEREGSQPPPRRVAVRKSLDIGDDAGEIVIGQAQAYEVRSQRRPSVAQMSMRSSTSAATIEVMYTPEPPFSPFHYPRSSSYSGSKRSSHVRQPSVIHEDEDIRPKTAINVPLSPPAHSFRSVRTSTSEPRPRSEGKHKFMEVTAEEETLLELMRKKRAAMNMMQMPPVALPGEEQERPTKSHYEHAQMPYRTSGFLAEASPVRVVEHKATKRSSAIAPSPLQMPPRGRPLKTHYDSHIGTSQLRDSSTSDAWSDSPASRTTMPPHLPTPGAFSPLDPFPPPSPVPTAGMASPTTTEHASPLPSPITPGLRAYEGELNVKVANSDTSNEIEEVPILPTGVIDVRPDRTKVPTPSQDPSSHRRRRTASSGADVSFPVPPTHGVNDLHPVPELSSRPPSILEPPMPRLPHKSSKRISGLAVSANGNTRSRQSSVHSSHSRASSSQSSTYAHAHAHSAEKKSSRLVSRQSSSGSLSISGTARGKRNSVNDDVLAAWNALGGTY